jgi:hypothetical protein
MAQSSLGALRKRTDNYTAYSIGCAVVWAGILAGTERWAGARRRDQIQTTCAGWWMGWTSATIARFVYPPPKKWRSPTTT